MARRGRPKSTFQLTIGTDPKLNRFGSLAEALRANTDLLAELIRQGDALRASAEVDTTNQPQPEAVTGGD